LVSRVGAAGTLNFVSALLEAYYGSRHPAGTFIFLRLRPFHAAKPTVRMDDMSGMQMKQDRD